MSGDSKEPRSEYDFRSVAPDELNEQDMARCIAIVSDGAAVSRENATSGLARASALINYRQSRRGTQRVIDEALGRVEAVITVGGRELAVTGVTIGQRISFSSSLKVAVSEVCQFAAQGELTVSAEYGIK